MVKKKQHHGTVSAGAGVAESSLGAGIHCYVRIWASCNVLPPTVDQFFKVRTVGFVPRKCFDGFAPCNSCCRSKHSNFFAKGSEVAGKSEMSLSTLVVQANERSGKVLKQSRLSLLLLFLFNIAKSYCF